MVHSLCKVDEGDNCQSERYPGDQHDVAIRLALAGTHDRSSLSGKDFELLMAEQLATPQRPVGVELVQSDQCRGFLLENFLRQHMAFNLHFAEHNVQRTDEIRNAMGQGQVDQLDTWRHWQTGVTDDHPVAMAQ
ncbi:hypothetical protein D3C87_1320730 [compost metagenome]